MFRALFVLILAFAAAVAIDPIWNAKDQQLTLRVRGMDEIAIVAVQRVRQLSELIRHSKDGDGSSDKAPAVAAPPPAPPARPGGSESLTQDERRRLGKLVEETTRGG